MTQLGIERFQDKDKYAGYLCTIEGRLRSELGWSNLRCFLPADPLGRRALDVGGGTGILALCLAELGFAVELLDSSEPMLAVARKEANLRELSGRISLHQGDAARLSDLFQPSSFHVVVCHNLLEHVEDPIAVLSGLAHMIKKDGKAVISLLVRNRCGEVLKAAINGNDLELAKRALGAETALDSLYGGSLRVFDPLSLRQMLEQAGLEVIAERGVRVVSDYLKYDAPTEETYKRLLDLELLLGAQPPFAAIARYTQMIARASSRRQE